MDKEDLVPTGNNDQSLENEIEAYESCDEETIKKSNSVRK
jgi:hypothetical protein